MDASDESVPGITADIPYTSDSNQRCISFKRLLGIFILLFPIVCLIVYQFSEHNAIYEEQEIQLHDKIPRKIHAIRKHLSRNQSRKNPVATDVISEIHRKFKNGSVLDPVAELLDNAKDQDLLKYLVNISGKSLIQKNKNIFRKSKTTTIDCSSLFRKGNRDLIERSVQYMQKQSAFPSKFLKRCEKFVQEMKYITSSLTDGEKIFPIAYSLTVYKDAVQVERLLRSIYRPQNLYCIHIDKKSKPSFKIAMKFISSCFNNVFISRSVKVSWGTFSSLKTHIICMKDLLKYKGWKYYMNLSGQEFPLRTNKEIVDILKVLNGANLVVKVTNSSRYRYRWENAGEPPHGIHPVKGSTYVALNRQFVKYVVYNQTAKDFLEWVKRTTNPDEVFYNSLNYNPQLNIPGSYTGLLSSKIPKLSRFVKWEGSGLPCYGKFIRQVCVFGIGDLPSLARSHALFTNKFYYNYQPVALDCMEELIYNRTRDEYLTGKSVLNITYYKTLKFIKQIVK